ncbi:hypothetical protein VTK73DRAFT_8645 [Phialemonium thermophilum]|uniref:Uncharacterized protein n=1 Tax=Phialemonium thermophilum TaxID=223376 RepID=A0ABR3W732_9PEZI
MPRWCSSADRKNCAPKSASVTASWSMMVSDPMPANTRFLAISLARAFMVMRRMLALRIFSWAFMPHRRICLSYKAISSEQVVPRSVGLPLLVFQPAPEGGTKTKGTVHLRRALLTCTDRVSWYRQAAAVVEDVGRRRGHHAVGDRGVHGLSAVRKILVRRLRPCRPFPSSSSSFFFFFKKKKKEFKISA